jgi:hypothetical protein
MPNLVRVWILLSTLLVGAGWILSIFHQLNRTSYAIIFALAGMTAVGWLRKTNWQMVKTKSLSQKLRRRSKHPAPLLFLVLALLSLAAGLFYLPANADSNAYRIPRVLEWLGAGQWHWIHTLDIRMNIAGCNFEWLSAPLILFAHTDRFIFLINWISFLMLPGLIFSVFSRLQVRPRVAWWWMWILPSGWCYAMQASSDVNDSFAAVYALASLDFALRARENKRIGDIWLSLLAAALLTGTKQTIIPLVIVCAVAIFPVLRLLRAKPVATAAILIFCLLISFLPLALFNFEHTGTWTGIPANSGPDAMFWARCQPDSPLWGIVGNAFCLPLQNLEPPFFPWADKWSALMQHFLQTPFGSHFASFENFGYLRRAMTEETAGIGLGIVFFLVLISVCAICLRRRSVQENAVAKNDLFLRLLRWAPFLALLIFMAKVGSYQNARQLGPYYVFFFPLLLAMPGHSCLVRRRWWQWLGLAVILFTAALLVLARNRPLFPAETVIASLKASHPQSAFLAKVADSYNFWPSMRNVEENPFKTNLPPDGRVIGYATLVGFSEPGLWLSAGNHAVERILPDDASNELRERDIHYVVIGDEYFAVAAEKTIEEWLDKYRGEMVEQVTYDYGPNGPVRRLYLVRLH